MDQSLSTTQPSQPSQPTASTPNDIRLIDVPILDENMALNVLVSFLSVAQKRGIFSIAESAKIYECIQKFTQPSDEQPSNEQPQPSNEQPQPSNEQPL
jgi:hypothetical protein